MALIHEDGSGKADAESLVSVSAADAYHAAHGAPAAWTAATTGEKESALRYATGWVGYRWTWRGSISRLEQALPWPRRDVYDDEGRLVANDSVPSRIVAAVCEMALVHLTTPLAAPTDGGLDALEVGPISLDFSSSEGATTDYPEVRRLVRSYVEAGMGQTRTIPG